MINAADADVVVIATPVDLARLITIGKPAVRVRYDLVEAEGSPTVKEVLNPVLAPVTPPPGAGARGTRG
jgi:predicted GTPase